ncbi:stage II sporulation protein M [Nesterenkonia alba]|uniref:stage II sporulation protein M n=1 Tax=Nesterenkonia alba TaxID=515814 RepID=UPI0005254F68|nr:stage II sporulation protein M [Nesterenkonia alba]
MALDVDAFLRVHHRSWERLDELARRRHLTAEEIDELLLLYRRASTHVSMIQAAEPASPAAAQLSARIARARAHFTGTGENALTAVAYFVTQSLPAALYRLRWLSLAIAAAWIALVVIFAVWTATHPQLDAMIPAAERAQHAEELFVGYYYEHPHSAFASQVWTNNSLVAALCVGLGISGVWPLLVLTVNALNLGLNAGIMYEQQAAAEFWIYILPHGLLELTAVFVAAAAGLRIFWSWVAPGRQPRSASLVQETLRLITVAIGLAAVLLISGIIEGFVTGSELPYWLRISIGVIAFAAFWVYTLVLGSRAVAAGVTGGLGRQDSGQHQLTA